MKIESRVLLTPHLFNDRWWVMGWGWDSWWLFLLLSRTMNLKPGAFIGYTSSMSILYEDVPGSSLLILPSEGKGAAFTSQCGSWVLLLS